MGAATFAAKFQLPADSAVSSYYLFPPRPSACRLPLSRLKSAVLRQHWQCAPPQASELFSRFTRAVLHEALPHETCLNLRLEDVKKHIYIFLSCMNKQFPCPPMHERNLCAQDMSSVTAGCVRELGKPRRTVRADPARSQAPIGRGTLKRTRAAQDPVRDPQSSLADDEVAARTSGPAQGYRQILALAAQQSPLRPDRTVSRAEYLYTAALLADVLNCRDPRFGLSQMSWRTSVGHHPAEDTLSNRTVAWLHRCATV